MENENVNLDAILEGNEGEPIEKSEEEDITSFFAELDKSVNGAIFNEEKSKVEDKKAKAVEQGDELKVEEPVVEEPIVKEDSEELKRYKEYEPLINAIENDPGLVQSISNYLEGNESPKSVKDVLEIPEDFVFDAEEALTDGDSDSAKMLNYMVSNIVEQRLAKEREVISREQKLEQDRRLFMQTHGIDDSQFNELIEWSKSKQLTLEDLFYLKTRDQRDREIAKKTINKKVEQSERAASRHRSLASAGAQEPAEAFNKEEEIFKLIRTSVDGKSLFAD